MSQTLSLSGVAETKEFIQMIQWKDSQGLVFFMLDNYQISSKDIRNHPLINSFWIHFSKKLQSFYDPVNRQNYKPLHLNENYWIAESENNNRSKKSKYEHRSHPIVMELYFLNQKWKSMQEILYQSNPSSLNPIIFYNLNENCNRQDLDCRVKTNSNQAYAVSDAENNDDSGLIILPSYYDSD